MTYTTSTPRNSHTNDRLEKPATRSSPSCASTLRFGFGAGSERWRTSFWVPTAEYQMVATISTPRTMANGA